MISETPPFWWEKPDWRALALAPLAFAYGRVAGRRLIRANPPAVSAPVLCVGNYIVGGAGKTPTAIALAETARRMKLSPGFVTRGYGGGGSGVPLGNSSHDSARHVGDEPLLLARIAPTAVSPNRVAAARLLIGEGCDFIIMDDGFQSSRIHVDYALLVVDSRRGIGNGHVIPAGPLRAPLVDQMRRTDGLLRIGEGDGAAMVVRYAARSARPIFQAQLQTRRPSAIRRRRFLAFAGIGDPDKFYDSVRNAGGNVVLTRSFPDHHPYRAEELVEMDATARAADLDLITTAKDRVRIENGVPGMENFMQRLQVLEIDLVFDVPGTAERIIGEAAERARLRRIAAPQKA